MPTRPPGTLVASPFGSVYYVNRDGLSVTLLQGGAAGTVYVLWPEHPALNSDVRVGAWRAMPRGTGCPAKVRKYVTPHDRAES